MFPSPDSSHGTQVRPPRDRGWEAAYPALGEATRTGAGLEPATPRASRPAVVFDWATLTGLGVASEEPRERPQPGVAHPAPERLREQVGPAAPYEPPSWRATAGRALGLARAFLLLEDPALEARRDSADTDAIAAPPVVGARPSERLGSPGRAHEPADPLTHPHRRPPRSHRRSRRSGAVVPRPQPCLVGTASPRSGPTR